MWSSKCCCARSSSKSCFWQILDSTMGWFYFRAYVLLALCVLRNQGNLWIIISNNQFIRPISKLYSFLQLEILTFAVLVRNICAVVEKLGGNSNKRQAVEQKGGKHERHPSVVNWNTEVCRAVGIFLIGEYSITPISTPINFLKARLCHVVCPSININRMLIKTRVYAQDFYRVYDQILH